MPLFTQASKLKAMGIGKNQPFQKKGEGFEQM